MRILTHIPLGPADYAIALRLQEHLVDEVRQDPARAYVVTVEHRPAVITLGRRGRRGDILASQRRLADEGIRVHKCSRGGQVTCHGPGQLVAYPIWQLGRGGRSVHGHVHLLEEAIIRLLDEFGIEAARRCGAIGVYVGGSKIAAVGVAVTRWVCYHGLALNVQPDLSHFDMIVPCGEPGAAATSMAELLGHGMTMTDVIRQLVAAICDTCGFDKCVAAGTMPDASSPLERHA